MRAMKRSETATLHVGTPLAQPLYGPLALLFQFDGRLTLALSNCSGF